MNNWIWHSVGGVVFFGLGFILLLTAAALPLDNQSRTEYLVGTFAIVYIGMLYALTSAACMCPPLLLGRRPCR